MARDVVISTGAINSYGFRVLTEGIDTAQFERNPVLLWMHNRAFRGTKDEVLPIGRVENLRRDGERLIGSLVFDQADDFALGIQSKWDGGVLKMVSAGLDVISTSEEQEYLLPGQKHATITKCKLTEVSVVDIGANDEALALSYRGNSVSLAAGCDDLAFLNIGLNNVFKMSNVILTKLGLAETATEAETATAVDVLLNAKQELETLKSEREKAELTAINAAVDEAVRLAKLPAGKRESFIALGKTMGIAALNDVIAAIHVPAKPMDGIILGSNLRDYKKLSEVPEEEVEQMRDNDREGYVALFKAEYGFEPKIKN